MRDVDENVAGAAEPRTRTSSHVPQILADLERQIERGELKPGERLNESALASRLGVSRGPIREACRLLEQAGMVRTVLNRGMYVVELSVKEAIDIYEARAALFSVAASRAVDHMTSQRLADLSQLVDAMDMAIDTDSVQDFYPLNQKFHDAIIEVSGNLVVATTLAQLERRLHLFRRQGLVQRGAMRASNSEHRAIVLAIKSGDSNAAASMAHVHITGGKHRLMNLLATQASTPAVR